jgi:hypothetical protein
MHGPDTIRTRLSAITYSDTEDFLIPVFPTMVFSAIALFFDDLIIPFLRDSVLLEIKVGADTLKVLWKFDSC